MDAEISIPTPRRKRLGPVMVLALGGAGILLLLILGVTIGWLRSAQALDAELARIRAAGEPASAEELEAFYKAPPANHDTTQLWLAAFALLDTAEYKADAKDLPFVDKWKESIPLPGEPWPQLEAAEMFLANNREALMFMHRAAEKGGQARFPISFSEGIELTLPHCEQLRVGARLLALQSTVAGHRGRADAAIESIAAMLAAARSLDQEPLFLSQIYRYAICAMAVSRMEWLLSASYFKDVQLARLAAMWTSVDSQRVLRLALLGERAVGVETFVNPNTLGGLTPKSDQAMYLEIMAEMLAAANESGESREKAVENAERRVDQLRRTTGVMLRYPLTLAILPTMSTVLVAAKRIAAQRDSARVALAVERFHLRHERPPRKLDELAPTFMERLPIDPFDGAPLRYRIDATEYVIYSVGPDGIDQGGKWEPPEDLPLDLVFRVRRKDADQRPDSPTAEPQP